jgi:hypothetical protein
VLLHHSTLVSKPEKSCGHIEQVLEIRDSPKVGERAISVVNILGKSGIWLFEVFRIGKNQ